MQSGVSRFTKTVVDWDAAEDHISDENTEAEDLYDKAVNLKSQFESVVDELRDKVEDARRLFEELYDEDSDGSYSARLLIEEMERWLAEVEY